MENIYILIVEDEPLIAKDLAYMLEDLDYKIAGIAYNAEDALRIIDEQSVDLAILDINIEGEMSGIDLAKKMNQIPFIYLTSHSSKEVVAEAKRTGPLAYLVKPIDEHDLLSTIDVAFYNYLQKIDNKENQNKKIFDDVIFIKSGHSYVKVRAKDIIYVEANDNYCFIHTSHKKFLLSQTLKSIEGKLESFKFIRVHRSYLINPEWIEKFSEVNVHLHGKEIPISRKHKAEFKSRLNFL